MYNISQIEHVSAREISPIPRTHDMITDEDSRRDVITQDHKQESTATETKEQCGKNH